jgi:hypothetical protein
VSEANEVNEKHLAFSWVTKCLTPQCFTTALPVSDSNSRVCEPNFHLSAAREPEHKNVNYAHITYFTKLPKAADKLHN